jgi:predicted transporter
MPEFKSLLLGLVFSLGIFSVKSGCGISYLVSGRPSLLGKATAFALVTATYFLLFVGSWHICKSIDLVNHFNRLKSLFESGMVLHVLMAAGTLFWGISLLKGAEDSRLKSYGWIALVVPCPVCASAIFFITGFLVAFFPADSFSAVLGAYAVYLVTTLLTMAVLALSLRLTNTTPERVLGLAMLFVSAYFFLSVLLAPHFGELERVYRVARHGSKESIGNASEAMTVGFVLVLSFVTGFVLKRTRGRR